MKRWILCFLSIGFLWGQNAKCHENEICCATRKYVTVRPIQNIYQCSPYNWILVYEENFNGNALDKSMWRIRPWGEGSICPPFNAIEYNTLDNVEVSNGTMKIWVKNEHVFKKPVSWASPTDTLKHYGGRVNYPRDFYYTSSNIWTRYKFRFGKFEARIKIPSGRGYWPAFWLYTGEPRAAELDIFEFYLSDGYPNPSQMPKVHRMTAHHDRDNDSTVEYCQTVYIGPNRSLNFNVYTLIWNRDRIIWQVNGDTKRQDVTYYIPGTWQEAGCTLWKGYPYKLNVLWPAIPMYMIFNVAVQCDYAPDNTTYFPQAMEVDWVRVYQQLPCPSSWYIDDPSDYPIEQGLYNTIVGGDILVKNYPVPDNTKLMVMAENGVTLEEGFDALSGSDVDITIKPFICSSGNKIASYEVESQNNSARINSILYGDEKSVSPIKWIQKEEGFYVDFSEYPNFRAAQIEVFDIQGKRIFYGEVNKFAQKSLYVRLSRGTYLVKVSVENNYYTRWFVVY